MRCRENSLHARTGQLLPASVKQQHELLFQKFESYLEQLQDDPSTSKQLSVADARDVFVQQQGLSKEQQHAYAACLHPSQTAAADQNY